MTTNRRIHARNVRFYMLILNVAFMLILSDREHGCRSWIAAHARSRAAMMRLPCSAMGVGSGHDRVSFVFSVCTLSGRPGWRVGASRRAGQVPPALASWPRVRRGSARKGGASRCFPPSVWKGSWGALAGGGADPYAARPPPGAAANPAV